MGFLLFIVHKAVHDVLLTDLEHVVGQPVQDQPAREADEEDGHDDRHDEHHALLGGVP